MSALAKVKDKPLLEPPAREGERWWKVTAQDEVDMRAALEHGRKEGYGWLVGKLPYYMRELGLKVDVNEKDRKVINDWIKASRKGGSGGKWRYEYMFHFGRKLGANPDFTQEDADEMRHLAERGRDEYGKGGLLAEMLFYMKQYGLRTGVTDPEVKSMMDWLNGQRKVADGLSHSQSSTHVTVGKEIAKMHYYMMGLNVSDEITDLDIKFMEGELDDWRRVHKGENIAEMLFLTDKIMSPRKFREPAHMPPLKEYVK